MGKLKQAAESPLGAGMIGGLVVGVLGWIAIAAGWIHAADSDAGLLSAPAPLRNASDTKKGSTVNEIYKSDSPGVAFIQATSTQAQSSPFDLFGTPQRRTASGSGFVVDKNGDILTNNHVVAGATDIKVALGDSKRTVPAQKLGADPSNDLALIRVDPDKVDLHPLTLGDSSKVQVGDPVVAIGNPFGLDRTVTTGIVSALQREIQAPNGFTISHVIQTDASINPGNSGGPLLNAAGEVIGINSQIATAGGGGSVGVGFAIPIDTAREDVGKLRTGGQVKRAYLGIDGADIDSDVAKALNLPVDKGILVQNAFAGGPAAKAGIQGGSDQANINGRDILLGGDIITSVDGHEVSGMQDVVDAVDAKNPGDDVTLEVIHGGERRTVTATLGERPAQVQGAPQEQGQSPFGN
jgi:S1-C subfamily serine protease